MDIPDSTQLAAILNQAIGPAFLLGVVAGFISPLMPRLKNVTDQLNRSLEIADAPDQAKDVFGGPLLFAVANGRS